MADILNELTGRASGRVGNLVYRIKDGKTYLCSPPLKPKASTKPEVIVRRNRFKLTLMLSSALNKLLPLKYLWKNVNVTTTDEHKSAFTKMIKKNYQYVHEFDLTNLIYLAPTFGFGVTESDITLTNTSITVELDPIGTGEAIDLNIEKNVQLACVLFVDTPATDTNLQKYDFIGQMSDKVVLSLTNPLSFSIPLEGPKSEIFDAYTNKKAFFALITLDALDVPVQFSQTFHSV